MTTVKMRNRLSKSKRPSKKHLKRVSLKSKRPTKRKKVKRTRRSQRGGVSERKSAQEAISSMRAAQTYNSSNVFNERIRGSIPVKNTPNCRRSVSIKQYLISIGYNDNDDDGSPAIMSVVRSLSKLSIEDVNTMSKNEIDVHYAAWRLAEATRRKELRSLKKQGISVVRSGTGTGTSKKVRPVPAAPAPAAPAPAAPAAYDAAMAMMELDEEIDEEIDADAIRVMHECEIDTAEEMGYTDPPPTITADTIPPGFTPVKVKPNNNKSSMSNSNLKSKSLFDAAPSQAGDDEFMRFMDSMEQEDT